jgi:hypothetical protein
MYLFYLNFRFVPAAHILAAVITRTQKVQNSDKILSGNTVGGKRYRYVVTCSNFPSHYVRHAYCCRVSPHIVNPIPCYIHRGTTTYLLYNFTRLKMTKIQFPGLLYLNITTSLLCNNRLIYSITLCINIVYMYLNVKIE